VIDVSAGQDKAVLSGDVLHHPVQVERPDWNSIFDQDRAKAQATRVALVAGVADGHTHLIGAHFAGPTALRVMERGGHFSYE